MSCRVFNRCCGSLLRSSGRYKELQESEVSSTHNCLWGATKKTTSGVNKKKCKKNKDLDWTTLFSQGHLWSQKQDLLSSYTMSKTMSLSDHHHINIMHTRYQQHSVKARRSMRSLVGPTNAGVTSRYNNKTTSRAFCSLCRHQLDKRFRGIIHLHRYTESASTAVLQSYQLTKRKRTCNFDDGFFDGFVVT